jgi:hypothetical protein
LVSPMSHGVAVQLVPATATDGKELPGLVVVVGKLEMLPVLVKRDLLTVGLEGIGSDAGERSRASQSKFCRKSVHQVYSNLVGRDERTMQSETWVERGLMGSAFPGKLNCPWM